MIGTRFGHVRMMPQVRPEGTDVDSDGPECRTFRPRPSPPGVAVRWNAG